MSNGWTNERKNENIKNQLDIIKKEFPFKFTTDYILYLIDITINHANGGNNYMLTLIDNYGYKYYQDYKHIKSAVKYAKELNKFFKRNPFTYYNINNFCKINNIDLYIDGKGLPISGIAREKLEFINSKQEIIKVSWNEIQNSPERYRYNYSDILIERKRVRSISKEDAIKDILTMQSKLNRPIDCYDFRPKQKGHIGIRTIMKYWGEFRFMQEELGLVITGKYAKKLSDYECLEEIKDICNKVYKEENRKTLLIKDFKRIGTYDDYKKYILVCKNTGTTLRKYLKSLGFELQKAGNGLNFCYDDMERVVSAYEYDFTNYLRNVGLKYNQDYFRDVKYKNISSEYTGNMNCDYEIHFQGRIFYVELAGILGNVGHEKCYRENIPINSTSKEKYRLDLIKKQNIFVKENLEYYILLKSEMNENTYKTILNNDYKGVA